MKQSLTQENYTLSERNGQVVIALNSEYFIPEDAPVRLTNAQLEELDYRKLYESYSPIGRNPATDPRVMFKVLAYTAEELHIYSDRRIEDACRNRVDVIWLLGQTHSPKGEVCRKRQSGCRARRRI